MIVIVLFALLGAAFANVGAESADLRGVDAPARHEAGRKAANRSAVGVVTNAVSEHADMLLIQAGSETMVAGICTSVAGVHAGLMMFVCHGASPRGWAFGVRSARWRSRARLGLLARPL